MSGVARGFASPQVTMVLWYRSALIVDERAGISVCEIRNNACRSCGSWNGSPLVEAGVSLVVPVVVFVVIRNDCFA